MQFGQTGSSKSLVLIATGFRVLGGGVYGCGENTQQQQQPTTTKANCTYIALCTQEAALVVEGEWTAFLRDLCGVQREGQGCDNCCRPMCTLLSVANPCTATKIIAYIECIHRPLGSMEWLHMHRLG